MRRIMDAAGGLRVGGGEGGGGVGPGADRAELSLVTERQTEPKCPTL